MLRVACDQMAGIVAVGFGDLQCCFAYGCNVVCICIIGNTCSLFSVSSGFWGGALMTAESAV